MAQFSPTHSRLLHGNRPFVLANGKDAATIKIRLRDTNNAPIAGGNVELVVENRPDVSIAQPLSTDASGLAVGYLTATSPGSLLVQARFLSDTGPKWFAEPLSVTFFSRDIAVAPQLQQTPRNIHIEWAVSRQYYNDIDGIRVRIEATEATGMPTKIFAYQMVPLKPGTMEQVAAFDHVCSSVDLEEYPENAPVENSRPAWFRLNYVDVLLRSREETREFVNSVLEDVQILKNTLDITEELLPGGDVWIGTPPA